MLCDIGVVDKIVTTALLTIASTDALYVPHGRSQPTPETNSNNLPWFGHTLKITGLRKQIGSSETDRAEIHVILDGFCPAQAIQSSAYALSSAMTKAAALLCYQRFVDTPQTHQIVFDGYEASGPYDVGGGQGGDAALLVGFRLTINGLADVTA